MIQQIHTDKAPKAVGPYSQAVVAGPFVFLSGQIALDSSGKITDETIEGQMKQVLDNIEAILNSQGLTFEHVVKTEVYLRDMKDYPQMNTIYASRFTFPVKPARQAMQVAKLPLDARVEISCIAYAN